MEFRLTDEERQFQREIRDTLAACLPDDIRAQAERGGLFSADDFRRWLAALDAQGLAAPNWPIAHGGRDWSPAKRLIFAREIGALPAPWVYPFNIAMIGPVICEFGDEAMKQRFCAPLRNGSILFCQGFSEPGSGSDLASLRTTGLRDGTDLVINGHKVWTSYAHVADWIFLLARTEDSARPQQGLSIILVDMKTPGITVNPIVALDGQHHLNEVFFDDVRVPQANIVGRPGEGWTQAKFLLGHERTTIAGIAELRRDLARIDALVAGGDVGTFHGIDWQLRERTRIEARIEALSMLEARTALDPHLTAPHFASILKVAGTELQQQIDDFGLRLLGPAMLAMAPESVRRGANPAEPGPTGTSTLAGRFFYRRAASIYGGTSEIQRNLIARAVISDKQGHSA
jgi:alkylation response protein AidB-like acyl-CoA dehydrogenase